MYDIRQFRPTLYLLIAMGFTGFAIAVGTPLLWLMGITLLGLNAWLVKHDRFRPLPRWLANGLTLLAASYTAMQIYNDPRPIFPIGNFLLLLQLIKAYEQRGNRDYAQLLVLSLLLMVAAAISTAGLLFGMLFLIYLLVSPYACLLFHLKVETDHAKKQMGLDERLANPLTLRQDQRYLNRSMAHLTVLVAMFAIALAVIVFLFFPRGAGSNLLTLQFRPGMAATGMSDNLSMQSVASVQENNTEIAYVKITHNQTPMTGGEIYLRGTIYDRYESDPLSAARWSWSRTSAGAAGLFSQIRPGTPEQLISSVIPRTPDTWTQHFMPLKPIDVKFLVAMPGATSISVNRNVRLDYLEADHIITLDSALNYQLDYTVTSDGTMEFVPPAPTAQSSLRDPGSFVPGKLVAGTPSSGAPGSGAPGSGGSGSGGPASVASGSAAPGRGMPGEAQKNAPQSLNPRIREYAIRPEVSGTESDGKPLADSVSPGEAIPPPTADQIATHIETHLRTTFSYTLDLSGNRPKDDDADPIVDFLYDSKKGWCEHFAGAMTTMCQSLGLRARLVSGFKADEFNSLGGYFIVRQSHAHAWVEVLVRDGDRFVWKTFDPTSARDASGAGKTVSTWTHVKHFFNYLEHTWANSVVAYDASSQTSLLDTVETKMVNVTSSANSVVSDSSTWFSNTRQWLNEIQYSIREAVIITLVSLMSLTAVGLIIWYSYQRYRLMRRARRIGLDTLQGSEARRLARQLGFYEVLIDMLARRQIVRAPHLTPLEFGNSLSYLSNDAYRTIVRLTHIFYKVRYGQVELSPARRRSLGRVVDRLGAQLLGNRNA